MIIQGSVALPLGVPVTDVWVLGRDGESYRQPFTVLRESTRDEYLAQCADLGVPVYERRPLGPYFYEILTD
jgi:hypothetical protein